MANGQRLRSNCEYIITVKICKIKGKIRNYLFFCEERRRALYIKKYMEKFNMKWTIFREYDTINYVWDINRRYPAQFRTNMPYQG